MIISAEYDTISGGTSAYKCATLVSNTWTDITCDFEPKIVYASWSDGTTHSIIKFDYSANTIMRKRSTSGDTESDITSSWLNVYAKKITKGISFNFSSTPYMMVVFVG